MNPLFEAAAEIQEFCASRSWRSTIIGGLAVQRWGEPRQTRDVDLTVWTGFGTEAVFVDALLERFPPRRPDARQFALDRRVLLVEAANGVPLDISLAALPFEGRVIDRSVGVICCRNTVNRIRSDARRAGSREAASIVPSRAAPPRPRLRCRQCPTYSDRLRQRL